MTATRCARCDFRTTDDEPLAAHAIGAGHPLCRCCTRSLTEHEPSTCERCLTDARTLLAGIATMFGELGQHLGHLNGSLRPHTSRSTDGAPLPGATVLVMLAGGSEGLSDDAETAKDTDPPSVAYELGWWALEWQDTRGEHEDLGHSPARTVLKASGYLERKMRWAANSHDGFEVFLADLKRLHAICERATGRDLPVERAGADCFECGGNLIRVVDRTTGVSTEDVACSTCHVEYDQARYRLALRAAWERDVQDWLPLTEAARLIVRNVETVETWSKRGQVGSACRLGDGRKLVWWPDVQARMRELRERAKQAAEAKAEKLRRAS